MAALSPTALAGHMDLTVTVYRRATSADLHALARLTNGGLVPLRPRRVPRACAQWRNRALEKTPRRRDFWLRRLDSSA
jgi:hypothetical protein